jgi:hypothetical protein
MTTSAYTVNFSDTNKAPIVIEPSELNYDTTLTLFGRDSTSWGAHFNNNLVKILENFCNDYVPGYTGQVLEGQLWYDSGNKQLKLCTDSTNVEWMPLTRIPSPELTGIVTTSILDIRLADYIPLSGNRIAMTGELLAVAIDEYSNPLSVATKKYVDSIVCKCATSDGNWVNNYLSDTGGIISTTIILPNNITNFSYAATNLYVTSKNFITDTLAPEITVANNTVDVTNNLSGMFTGWPPAGTGIYKYYGTIIIPGTTALTPHVCVCTFTDALATTYNVNVSGTILNNKDVAGTIDTGSACDAYVDIISGTEFQIKCSASTFAQLIYVTVFGHKA